MIPVTRRFTLRGDCMLPLLEPGDEVWVRGGDPVAGRLIAYARFNGRLPEIAVHRRLAGGRMRADARLACDPVDEAAAFVGRVVALSRGGRVAALESRRGRALDAFSRLYARTFLAAWREGVLNPLDGVLGDVPRRLLRWAALQPPRLLFRVLFGPGP
ncbi:MAG: hypothetical protein HYZ75_07860 [Elusimicrobia bacterium]|nr:hypothetical protein [Elusimicrobiota bacterium]